MRGRPAVSVGELAQAGEMNCQTVLPSILKCVAFIILLYSRQIGVCHFGMSPTRGISDAMLRSTKIAI